jgi:hypothetical protein
MDKVGKIVTNGVEYKINSFTLFREAEYNRILKEKGKSIYIYKSKDDYKSKV